MKYTVTTSDHETFTVLREDTIVLISAYPSRVADIIDDMLKHEGRLTLIPEPPKERSES